MPVFWMGVLGIAFSGERTERFGVGLYRAGVNPSVASAITELQRAPSLKLHEEDLHTLNQRMMRGDVVLIMELRPEGIHYRFDPTNPAAVRAQALVDDLIQRAAGRLDVLPSMKHTVEIPGNRYVDFLIPGLLALSIMSTSLFGIAMTIVSNRKENILKLFMVTPMRPSHYLLSHIIGRLFSLAVEFSSVMFFGWLIFGFSVRGSALEYTLTAILGAGCFTAIAMACASRTRSIPMISGMTNLIMILMVMMSGVFFAKSNFPDWMQGFINLLPLTALVDALRRIALEGAGLVDLTFQLGVLLAYMAVGFIITRWRFRWY
jgi:ABC-type multidrug transport system permease subunit